MNSDDLIGTLVYYIDKKQKVSFLTDHAIRTAEFEED